MEILHDMFAACANNTVHGILYADDSALTFHSAEGLQKFLDITSLFCDTQGMKVSTLETDVVIFSPTRSTHNHIWKYKGLLVQVSE